MRNQLILFNRKNVDILVIKSKLIVNIIVKNAHLNNYHTIEIKIGYPLDNKKKVLLNHAFQ